jgi:acyl-CoA synthetase (AMP-forming)/AMP-acid ligase II
VSTIFDHIDDQAVLAEPSGRLFGGALRDAVTRVASGLVGAGLTRESRVALVASGGVETAITFLGIARACICVPVNPELTSHELSNYFAATRVDLVLTVDGDGVADRIREAGWTPRRVEELRIGDQSEIVQVESPHPDDLCLLLSTSGTTSRPKLVPLTHRNLVSSARNIAKTLDLTTDDLGLLVMPLFHIHGLVAGLLAPLSAGSGVYCLPGPEPTRILSTLATEPVTWYTAAPTIHQAIVGAITTPPVHSLRFVRSSSSALGDRLAQGIERVLGVPVVEAYGMTEASHQIASNPLPPGRRVPGSVGRPTGAEVAIGDADGKPVRTGEVGSIMIRGESVIAGYLGAEQAFANGWFVTGDEGHIDDDGYLYLHGRTRELINRGGEKIFPKEIDDVIECHPLVAAALSFSVPHPRLGEDVAAVVVPLRGSSVDPQELRDFAARYVAPFKVPRSIVLVDELPKGPTGKPRRVEMANLLGLTTPTSAAVTPSDDPTESALQRIWAEVLSVDLPAIDDDFFGLGGDSLLATMLLRRVDEYFGARLPIASVYDAGSTVAGMAGLVHDQSVETRSEPMPTPERDRLAPQQKSLWTWQQFHPDSAALNTVLALELHGELDIDALRMALDRVIRRHEMLRTRYPDNDGIPCLVIDDDVRVTLESGSLESCLDVPFEIETGPLVRALLARRARGIHILALIMHHLVCDAWTRDVIARDLLIYYGEAVEGRQVKLPELTVQGPDIASWQHRIARPEKSLRYWQEVYGDLGSYDPSLSLAGPVDSAAMAGRVAYPVKRALLAERARDLRISPFELFLCCTVGQVGRQFDKPEFGVGVPVANRDHPALIDQVGYYATVLPIRAHVSPDRTVMSFRAAARHADVPLDQIIAQVDHRSGQKHGRLFDIVVRQDLRQIELPPLTSLSVTRLDVLLPRSQYPLVMSLTDSDLVMDYDTSLITAEEADALATGIRNELK